MLTQYGTRAFLFAMALTVGCSSVPRPLQKDPRAAPPATFGAGDAPPSLPRPGGVFGELDKLFLDSYKARREILQSQTSPVIVVFFGDLILYRDGKEEDRAKVIPDEFHVLKAFAHLPFAIYLRLAPVAAAGEVHDSLVSELRLFEKNMVAAELELQKTALSPLQLERQRAILTASTAIITQVIRSRSITSESLQGFAAGVGPLLLDNASDAACLQIGKTHEQVLKWRAVLGSDDWKRLVVVNRSKHQSRYRNIATQYFAWLFTDRGDAPDWSYPGESMRVFYAEFLSPNEKTLDFLGTVLLDAEASRAFFGDPWRLSEDILSDGAARCIAGLPRERE